MAVELRTLTKRGRSGRVLGVGPMRHAWIGSLSPRGQYAYKHDSEEIRTHNRAGPLDPCQVTGRTLAHRNAGRISTMLHQKPSTCRSAKKTPCRRDCPALPQVRTRANKKVSGTNTEPCSPLQARSALLRIRKALAARRVAFAVACTCLGIDDVDRTPKANSPSSDKHVSGMPV